jgi:hypothetical protein
VHSSLASTSLLSVSKIELTYPACGLSRSTCGECACCATLGSTGDRKFSIGISKIDSPMFETL